MPQQAREVIKTVWLKKVIGWIKSDSPELKGRDRFLESSLKDAVSRLTKRLGEDMSMWQYGQENYHHVYLRHPLSDFLSDSLRNQLDCGPMPRGGNGFTVGSTSNTSNQSSGATFRMVVDLSDWEKTMFSNGPGQSGNPNSPYYKNLFSMWANDQFFIVPFSKSKIQENAREKTILIP